MNINENTPEDVLSQLNQIASMVMYAAEADTLEQVLQRIADATRELVHAKYAALGVPDGKGSLKFFKVSGLSEDDIAKISHPPIGAGLLGVIMNERQTLRLPHMQADPRAAGFPAGHPDMTSLLGVPIQIGDQLFGMLYLTDKEDGAIFTVTDQWLVESLAGYAALAIAGSQLREQKNRLSLLEERQRISMELHDGVIQSLYAIGMHLDLIRNGKSMTSDDLLVPINGLNEVIEDIRKYIMNLNALSYRRKTIREALNDIISRLYIPDSINFHFEAPDEYPPFSDKDFESICFVVREALSNAFRHSQATNVSIRCWEGNSVFRIVIADDGVGFDQNSTETQNGLGLLNIRERTQMHNGTIDIQSLAQNRSGTTLSFAFPKNPEG